MKLRIFFEPHDKMEINDISVFEYYGGNYLADFDAKFGGYISMNAFEKVGERFEPVWQFIMSDVGDRVVAKFLHYIRHNPMNGYYVHVYEDRPGSRNPKLL